MDIEAVHAEWEQAYQEGWVELSFSATANADLKTKPIPISIPNQEDFIYCKRTMDPVAAQQDAIIAAGLSDDFRSAIQNNPNMSQELQNALEQSIVRHSGADNRHFTISSFFSLLLKHFMLHVV